MQHHYFSIVNMHGKEALGVDRGRCDPAEQMCSSGADKRLCWTRSTEPLMHPSWLPITWTRTPASTRRPALLHPGQPCRGAGSLLHRSCKPRPPKAGVLLSQGSHMASPCCSVNWLPKEGGGCGAAAADELYSCCFLPALSAPPTRHSGKPSLPYSLRRFPASKAGSSRGEKSRTKTGKAGRVDGRRRHRCPILQLWK